VDRHNRAQAFRTRLEEALARSGQSKTALARTVGVDRSTLSHLLSADAPRLPSGHVVAELAEQLAVSADWLLGLAQRPHRAAEILETSLEITDATRSPADQHLRAWHREAQGTKIRHVPADLPDIFKTAATLRFEYGDETEKRPEQVLADMRETLGFVEAPGTDVELCVSTEALERFAAGRGAWAGFDAEDRRAQLAVMAELCDRHYPSLRLYFYEPKRVFSSPVAVLGRLIALIYVGRYYFAFRGRTQIDALTRHFDLLVREAAVEARDAAAHIRAVAARAELPV
jgi:transcriptional regulator with XRE-family HTH domain